MRALFVALMMAIIAPAFGDDISRCVIAIDGKTWTDGPCKFTPPDDGQGSFIVTDARPEPNTFAYVFPAGTGLPRVLGTAQRLRAMLTTLSGL